MWHQCWTKRYFLCKNKMVTVTLSGLGKARELDRKAASCSFLQQREEIKKKLIVSPPFWPLTARHKFPLRLSRNLTLGLRSRKENSKLFLRVNANKISSEVSTSKGQRVSFPLRGCGWALLGHTQGPGSLLGSAPKPVMPPAVTLPRPAPGPSFSGTSSLSE